MAAALPKYPFRRNPTAVFKTATPVHPNRLLCPCIDFLVFVRIDEEPSRALRRAGCIYRIPAPNSNVQSSVNRPFIATSPDLRKSRSHQYLVCPIPQLSQALSRTFVKLIARSNRVWRTLYSATKKKGQVGSLSDGSWGVIAPHFTTWRAQMHGRHFADKKHELL